MGDRKFTIVRPDEATGHPDEVIDAVVPVESVEVDKGALVIRKAPDANTPPPKDSRFRPVTVSDIINQCNTAIKTMGVNNQNRHLLWNCAFALRQLVDKLDELAGKLATRDEQIARFMMEPPITIEGKFKVGEDQ